MHELAITEGILETVLPAAEKAGAERILEIRMKIGVLSGVVPGCIKEYLRIAAKGTIAENARLIAEPIPVRIRCRACGREADTERGRFCCAFCGSESISVIGGSGYWVDSLKVE